MGLFSTKKTIVVSSTVYNMAGVEADRPNFIKSSMFSAVMNPYNAYLGETIVMNYLTGPGIRQRSYFNWAVRTSYPGLPTYSATQSQSVDPAVVKPFITVPGSPAGLVTEIQTATIGDGDYSYFAEQYILANSPELANSAWIAEYDAAAHTITIQYSGGATVVIPGGIYDKDKAFLTANYYHQIPNSLEALIVGATTSNVIDPLLLPSIAGYTLDSTVNTGVVNHTLNYNMNVTKVYSNGDPTSDVDTTPTEIVPYNGTHKDYSKVIFEGGDGVSNETVDKKYFHHLFELREIWNTTTVVVVVNDLGGGDTETVTTTKVGDHLRPVFSWNTDTQDTIKAKVVGGPQLYIYEMGSGTAALDALESSVVVSGTPEYYPFMPIRLDNKSINHADFDDQTGNGLYAVTNTSYRRASGGGQQFSALVDEVENNPDLNEIDFANVQMGVSLNVIEKSCRKYIYTYIKGLIPLQNTNAAYMAAFQTTVSTYQSAISTLNAWTAAQNVPADPLYNTARPVIPSLSQPKSTTIKLKTTHASLKDYDNRISWVSIEEQLLAGVGKVGAVKGDVWIEKDGSFTWDEPTGVDQTTGSSASSITNSIEKINIFWQTDTNNYKKLTVWGLVHENFIYGGKAVKVTGHEAIDDADPSGFLIFLHAPTVKTLGLKDSTQMATANTFIVFNSYEILKKKWYQTFLGMLFIIIAIVVLAAIVAPAAIGGISGAFGTNAAVGSALGLSGTAGVVAGAVTNAIAAIVISTTISTVSINVFGEKWGAIIGAIVGFAISFGMTQGFGNLSISNLMTPQNILGFSSALSNGYAGYSAAVVGEINSEMVENQSEFDKQMKELDALIRELGGSNDLSFDPMQLTDSLAGNGQGSSGGSYVPETLDEFIHRTTMTGSDIVEITLALVGDYADLNLELPR